MRVSTFYFGLALVISSFLSCGETTPTADTQSDTINKEVKAMNNKSPSLKNLLDEKKAAFEERADENKKKVYNQGIETVATSGILESAKNVGDNAPSFTLNNATGQAVALEDYLDKGLVVLTWYRGGWCPYCNMTLHHLQLELENFKAHGANLIALTPEMPDKSLNTAEKNDLEFEVLSDISNTVGKEYGIVFELPKDVAVLYNQSFSMEEYNGDTSNELPLAATYIINQEGEIIYAFLDADYRNRAEPSAITEALRMYTSSKQ